MSNVKPLVRVNQDVYYYPNAVASVPLAAKVVAVSGVMVTLIVWEAHHWIEKSGVFHRDAPQLKTNTLLASRFGIWDYMDPPVHTYVAVAPVAAEEGSAVSPASDPVTSSERQAAYADQANPRRAKANV